MELEALRTVLMEIYNWPWIHRYIIQFKEKATILSLKRHNAVPIQFLIESERRKTNFNVLELIRQTYFPLEIGFSQIKNTNILEYLK